MRNKTIKVGVIGLGVGEAHIKSYKKIKNVEVLAVCDLNIKRLEEIKKKYNISVEEVEIVKEDVTFKIPGKLN